MKNPLRKRTVLDLSPKAKVGAYVVMIGWAIIVLFPLYWLLLTSFKQPVQFTGGTYYLPFIDFQPTLDNWKYILVDVGNDTYRPYINTLVIGFTSASIALVLGSLAAYGLVRYRYRPRIGVIALGLGCTVLAMVAVVLGTPPLLAAASAVAVLLILTRAIGNRIRLGRLANSDIGFWLISMRMMPPVAVVIPIYVLFQTLHLLDTQIALIVTYAATNLPIVVWLMSDYFAAIPLELEESASVDGASPYRTFRSIVLPVAVPGLVATFILVLVFAWNEYLIALFLATANAATMPLLVAGQVATRGPQYWYMSVLIVIMILPVIVMAVILERFISRGILAGAVKG